TVFLPALPATVSVRTTLVRLCAAARCARCERWTLVTRATLTFTEASSDRVNAIRLALAARRERPGAIASVAPPFVVPVPPPVLGGAGFSTVMRPTALPVFLGEPDVAVGAGRDQARAGVGRDAGAELLQAEIGRDLAD